MLTERRRTASWALGLLLTSAAGAPAGAQEPGAPPPDEVLPLPPVIVTAPARLPGAPLPLSQIPSRVDVLSGEALRQSGPASLQEALTRLPGVTLSDEQGNVLQQSLSFRGFQVSPITGVPQGISVFVDGVRVNEPTAEEVNFDLLPLDDIDHIELIRGPSAVFGRNTLGGALNIITRRGQESHEFVSEAEGGSFGRQRYRFRLSGPASPFDYYVSGSLFEEDGWRQESSVRLGKIFAKVGVTAGGTDATLSFQRSQDRIEQPGSLPQSELPRERSENFTPGDFFKPLANLVTATVRQDVGAHTRLTLNSFVRTLDAEQFNVNLLTANTQAFDHTTSVGTALQLDHDATLAGHADRLTAGVEYTHHDVAYSVFVEPHGTGERLLNSKVFNDQQAVAVYLQNTLTAASGLLAATDSVVLTTGARWDWLSQDIGDESPIPGQPRASGTSTFERANPRVGLNYNVTPSTAVYFSFGQGFRAPAFLELTCASPSTVCPGLQAGVAPDPSLKPVTVSHYELGARARPLPWLALEGALYRTDVSDDIFSVSPTGTTAVFFQNVGATRRQGVELQARATLGRTLEASVNYAYTEATFRDNVDLATPRLTPGCVATPCIEHVHPGDEMPMVPRHRANATIDYHVTPWLALWVSGALVGEQRLRGDEANVDRQLAAYTQLNTGARVQWRALTAFVTINNVVNGAYETFGTYAVNGKLPGAPVERFLTPALPIRFVGGLSYRF